ncbi:MAG: sugar kinase [Pseudomonadota bacterium]
MTVTVACIGEAMIELSLRDETPDLAGIGIAGDTLNTAVYLKRAAPDLAVDYVTRVGTDALSKRIIGFIEDEDVGSSRIGITPDRGPGLYAISTDARGERSFTYWRETSAARTMFQKGEEADLEILDGTEVMYLSAITLAILSSRARAALLDWITRRRRRSELRVAFDSNYRPRLWEDRITAQRWIESYWRQTDIALPSLDDEQAIFGDLSEDAVIERLLRWGARHGALKRGASGPRSLSGVEIEALPVVSGIVDTTAAGDSFNGGYLAAHLTGMSEMNALQAGHGLAVRVIRYHGAILPKEMPTA